MKGVKPITSPEEMDRMHEQISLHGLQISNVTMEQTLNEILAMLGEDRVHTVFTPNAEIVMQSFRDKDLASLLNSADLLLPDGAGVVLGAKILGTPLKEKVSGIDTARGLLRLKRRPPLRFYLFGGRPGVAEQAAIHLLSANSGIEIAGFRNGYFDASENETIVREINLARTDILFVCLGAPKQERWIGENRNLLHCRVAMGLGGSLDIFAGTGKLAPEWMRKAGLEWLFRLMREPHRWRRMLDLPRFIFLTIAVRWRASATKKP